METRKINFYKETIFSKLQMQSLLLNRLELAFPGILLTLRVSKWCSTSSLGCDPGENGYTPKTVQRSWEECKPMQGKENPPERSPGWRHWEQQEHGNQRGQWRTNSLRSSSQKEDTMAGKGDDGVTFYLSTIFHGSILKHITGRNSLILPEEAADLKGSLGSKN